MIRENVSMFILFLKGLMFGLLASPVVYFLTRVTIVPILAKHLSPDQKLVRFYLLSLLFSMACGVAYSFYDSTLEVEPEGYGYYQTTKAKSFDLYKKTKLDTQPLQETYQRIEGDKIITKREMIEVERISSSLYGLEIDLHRKEREAQALLEAKQVKTGFTADVKN